MNSKKIVEKWKARLNAVVEWTKRHTVPGFGHLSIFEVGSFFVKGMSNGTLGIRAASIAFNFFLAVFPGLLFLSTLIPYIPIPNFQTELMDLLEQLIPSDTFETIEETLADIVMYPRSGLLSIGCITTVVIVSNGVTAVIRAFNTSINVHETRSFVNLRVSSLIMVGLITVLLATAIALLIFGRTILAFLIAKRILFGTFSTVMFYVVQWLIILTLCIVSVSVIYYFAPAKRTHMGFISTGSVMATILLLATSAGFGYYLANFSNYNALYGSIGTLIAILVWLNINANILLLGFELNLSIQAAHENNCEALPQRANS
ncbi:MAG: YihY/virulence factor BrkB family protein [Salinivirgaceae bacterium]|nr:YihY/virulence factor BrkB family protein [Salinivirgaceae bacterium]